MRHPAQKGENNIDPEFKTEKKKNCFPRSLETGFGCIKSPLSPRSRRDLTLTDG